MSMNKLALIWRTKDLRNKVLIVLGLLILTRVLAHVPNSGIDASKLLAFSQQSQFFSLLDIFFRRRSDLFFYCYA